MRPPETHKGDYTVARTEHGTLYHLIERRRSKRSHSIVLACDKNRMRRRAAVMGFLTWERAQTTIYGVCRRCSKIHADLVRPKRGGAPKEDPDA